MRDPLNPRLLSQGWPRLAWAFAACLVALPCMAATTCATSATGVAFGLYNPLSGTPNNATGSVFVRCQMGGFFDRRVVFYTVELSTGGSGSFVTRTLRSGANPLDYNLYIDPAHTQIWGADSGGASVGTGRINLRWFEPAQDKLIIYGSIPAAQYNVVPGMYSDMIVVTVTY